ncbi:MAG: HD-GYP domain-containing protein [Armatimonadota bacterium]
MSTGWNVLIGLTLICILAGTLWIMCRRHNREMAAHVGAMAILTASMQPPEIRAHCRRVADISERIAREMRLPAKRLALVRAVGIIHEIDGIESITVNMPLEFAILDVADYYDVLTHDGSESMSTDEAMEEIRRRAGTRYAPVVARALMRVMMHSKAVVTRE